MLIIIGESRAGKTPTAHRLANERKVISASTWIRDIYPDVNDPIKFSELSKNLLKNNPDICIQYLNKQIETYGRENILIEGIRNPRDLLAIVKKGDHILDLGGIGQSGFEIEGLEAIRGLRKFLNFVFEITWSDYKEGNIILFPEPLKVYVFNSFLFKDDRPGTTEGTIVAFECYPGLDVTAMFKSMEGGVYHDVPFEQCITNSGHLSSIEDYSQFLKNYYYPNINFRNCYTAALQTAPRLSITPFNGKKGDVKVFDPNRNYLGEGKSSWILHWPEENLLLHLVEMDGLLLLWPSHKLLWTKDASSSLPDWKKNRLPQT